MTECESKSIYFNCVVKTNKELNDIVKKDIKYVESLDYQIESLLRQRNYILTELNSRTTYHKNFRTLFVYSPKKVMEEYKDNGFMSEIVKNVVMKIRVLFFDDTDKRHQDFSCTQIIHESYQDSIQFVFIDSSVHEIMFTFNISNYNPEYLYRNKYLTGYMYFSAKEERDFYTIHRTFDIHEIRNSLKNYIENGYVSEHFAFEHEGLERRIGNIFSDFEKNSITNSYFKEELENDN